MRTGTGNGARKRDKNSVSALGPPVEVPITKSFGGPESPVLRGVGITGFAAGLAVDGVRLGGRVSKRASAGLGAGGVVGRTGLAICSLTGCLVVGAGRRFSRFRPNVLRRGMSWSSTVSKTERSFLRDEGLVT